MTTCKLPPKGWACSRDEGHEGPCAASETMPYNDYADRAISSSDLLFGIIELRCRGDVERIDWVNATATITKGELRQMLIDAWMDGLQHSLVLIEGKK